MSVQHYIISVIWYCDLNKEKLKQDHRQINFTGAASEEKHHNKTQP